jgi:hypothetical protein
MIFRVPLSFILHSSSRSPLTFSNFHANGFSLIRTPFFLVILGLDLAPCIFGVEVHHSGHSYEQSTYRAVN